MRRYAQVTLTLAALCAVLVPGVARASLGSDLFARCFGEQTDGARQAFSTDFAAESPLRDYALHVVIAQSPPQAAPFALASVSLPKLADAVFAKGSFASLAPVAVVPQNISIAVPQAPTVEYYTEAAPLPTDPPAFYRFDLDSASGGYSERVGANGRVGRVRFQTHAEAAQAPLSFVSPGQTSIGAGATLNARVGSRVVGVDVSSQLAHYTNADPTSSGLNNDMVPVFIPAFAGVSKSSVSAGLAVPVGRRVTANLLVDAQHLYGDTIPIDAYNTVFGAGLTYKLKGSGFLSLSAKQYRYQDNLLPSSAFTQTSANLTFTVKF